MKMLSSFSTTSIVTPENSYAGVSRSGTGAGFRNCAAKTSSSSTVEFDSNSYVFWVEYEATGGYAIARSDYVNGIFVAPVPVWKQPVLNGGIIDNKIVGISFADKSGSKSDFKDILYAASTTRVYATTNHYVDAASIVWYEIVTIGVGEANLFGGGSYSQFVYGSSYRASEHRGIAMAPSSSCNSDASIFRALEEKQEQEEQA